MNPIPLVLFPSTLLLAFAPAAEVTVESKSFFIEKTLTATALPGDVCTVYRLNPKTWTDFKILQVAPHGAKVAKGDVLLRFDSEDIDKKIDDLRRDAESSKLQLAQAEMNSEMLRKTAPYKLEAARRAAEMAKEENTYFVQTRRKSTEERAGQDLKQTEQLLSNQQEELHQLSKMYDADDVTEETEEIILTRQKDAVARAEFLLRMEQLDHKRSLEVTLPREAKTLADSERDSSLSLTKLETEVPRTLELDRLGLEAAKIAASRAAKNLTDLEQDRALFEIKAPADGWFYYGAIENGRWTPGEAAKAMVVNGRVPAGLAAGTFFPSTATPLLVAWTDDASARSLRPDLTGVATLAGREDVDIPVSLAKVANVPGPDGSYRADFTAAWPKDLVPAAGSPAVLHLITYQKAEVRVVPNKALHFDPSGWSVDVKMPDGRIEHRPVKRGRSSATDTEILEGVLGGEFVIVP